MIINITIDGISKSIKVNDSCFVHETVIANILIKVDEEKKQVVNFDIAID